MDTPVNFVAVPVLPTRERASDTTQIMRDMRE
jgi:hypothetical protein